MLVNDCTGTVAVRTLHVVWEMALDVFARQSDSNSVLKTILSLTVLFSVVRQKKKKIQLSIVLLPINSTIPNTNITEGKWIIKRIAA